MTGTDALAAGVALVTGYLLGGVPFAFIAARAHGIDIRLVGSGNVGATNLGRALGRRWGLLVLALDIAKGFAPVFWLAPAIAGWLGSSAPDLAAAAMGLGALLGHVFTPYLGLRGGKGVAVSIGVFAAFLSYWVALPLAGYALMRKATGYVSAGSMTLAVLLPVAAVVRSRADGQGGWPAMGLAGCAAVLILCTHRSNLARLVRGEELAAPVERPSPGDPAASGAGSTGRGR